MSTIDPKKFDQISQLSHFFFGLAMVFGTKVLTSPASNAYLWMCGLVVVYTAIKEGWYDFHYEDADTRGSSWEDFLYQAGAAVIAVLLILLSKLWL